MILAGLFEHVLQGVYKPIPQVYNLILALMWLTPKEHVPSQFISITYKTTIQLVTFLGSLAQMQVLATSTACPISARRSFYSSLSKVHLQYSLPNHFDVVLFVEKLIPYPYIQAPDVSTIRTNKPIKSQKQVVQK